MAHDTALMGVQVVIVIEDNVRYYSSFLPVIYSELMHHSQQLAPEGVNLSHRLMRIQARPKILLCQTFEEAWATFSAYRENVLGVISDIEFPMDGRVSPEAGVAFARRVREAHPDVPVALQSSVPANKALAESVGAAFLQKESPVLLHDLRRFMVENFGFGDFVFRLPDGTEVGRASDLRTLEELLRDGAGREHRVPLGAQPLLEVAQGAGPSSPSPTTCARARSRTSRDYEELRRDLIASIRAYREQRTRATIVDFDRQTFDTRSRFTRIGGGSLGGKARGLAFVNLLLDEYGVRHRFPDVEIDVPPSVVVATDAFDRFLDDNDLRGLRDRERRRRRRSRGGSWRRRSRTTSSTTWCRSSSGFATRWPCGRRACSRTRSTSRSPASTPPTCCRTTTPTPACASPNSRRPSSASTPPRSRGTRRRT